MEDYIDFVKYQMAIIPNSLYDSLTQIHFMLTIFLCCCQNLNELEKRGLLFVKSKYTWKGLLTGNLDLLILFSNHQIAGWFNEYWSFFILSLLLLRFISCLKYFFPLGISFIQRSLDHFPIPCTASASRVNKNWTRHLNI